MESIKEALASLRGYPKSIKFIMGNEICERFSFYGLKAVLALYLQTLLLGFSFMEEKCRDSVEEQPKRCGEAEDTATSIVHAFIFGAYFSSVLGAIVSDSFLGKYKTILYVSILYACGNVVVSISSIELIVWGSAVGLVIVALATGGIKSNVSSFVGDQFDPESEQLLTSVYSLFYYCINIGSLLSTFATPLLRAKIGFYAAFGVPAFLLVVSTVVFWLGTPTYRIVEPGSNIFAVLFKLFKDARQERALQQSAGVDISGRQLLDFAPPSSKPLVAMLRKLTKVFYVFIPLPIFWALFDQHASRWIFQAKHMNLHIGSWTIQPDQMPTLNPLLLMILIPVFNIWIYPFLRNLGLSLAPVQQRMVWGMILTALSFVSAGFVQLKIDENDGDITVLWQFPQYILLTSGEILVSITGLEFSYSQAPEQLKAVVMAGWLLTTAFGNAFVLAIVQIEGLVFPHGRDEDSPKPEHLQMLEFFFFASLMLLFTIVFAFVNRNYSYNSPQPVGIVDEVGAASDYEELDD